MSAAKTYEHGLSPGLGAPTYARPSGGWPSWPVSLRLHLRVDLTDPDLADQVGALDADDRRVNLSIMSGMEFDTFDRLRLHDGRSEVLSAPERVTTLVLYKAGEEVTTARVWKSANENSRLGVLEDLYITVRRGAYDQLESTLDIPAIVEAPVAAGQPVAELKIKLSCDSHPGEFCHALDCRHCHSTGM